MKDDKLDRAPDSPYKLICGILAGIVVGMLTGQFTPNRNIVTADQLDKAVTLLQDESAQQTQEIDALRAQVDDLSATLKATKTIP